MYYIVILPTYVVYSREVDWTNASSKMLHTSQSVPFWASVKIFPPYQLLFFAGDGGWWKYPKKLIL